jgi:LCP family protein required for cell wall assembly
VPEPKSSKTYRTYRGGRAGNDPESARFDFGGGAGTIAPPRERTPAGMPRPNMRPPTGPPVAPGRPGPPRPQGPRRFRPGWKRGIAIAVAVVVALSVLWIYLGYRAFSNEMANANARIGKRTRAALTPAGGSVLTTPQVTMIMGSDSRTSNAESDARSDSILLVRTDPGKHLVSMLSIPRDLYVPIPGHSTSKINAAFAWGGPPLLIHTVNRLVNPVKVNHVVLVDFKGFRELIDSLGGVTIYNPTVIQSSQPFDGHSWHFEKGTIHLDGVRALAYSRIRHTTNPADSDITRELRQQRVMQALSRQLVTPSTLFHLPSVGRALARPLSTDLTAPDMLEMGWVKFRAGRTLQCHLSGTPQNIGGQDVLMPSEQNRAVVQMFLGDIAPQRPAPGNLWAPGCSIK